MDKLSKALKKLTQKERAHIARALTLLQRGDVGRLDIKKLKGVRDIYRVRVGKLRIVFIYDMSEIRVLTISRRNEDTYRDF